VTLGKSYFTIHEKDEEDETIIPFHRILEIRIPLAPIGVPAGGGLRFQFSLWQGGLPMDAVPQQGWIAMKTTDPAKIGE
jgi:hypothetical protein